MPRVLVIDPTPIGSLCATGQFKQMLFKDWPPGSVLELTTDLHGDGETILRLAYTEILRVHGVGQMMLRINEFAPDFIYLRPEPSELQHTDFLLWALRELQQPAAMHIMDDWLAGDWVKARAGRAVVVDVARYIARRASIRYTDGPDYVTDFEQRLGVPFRNLLNGVNLAEWSGPPPERPADDPFTLTHMGNYDQQMSRQAIRDIAEAVHGLRQEFPVRLDVYVRDYIIKTATRDLRQFRGVRVLQQGSDFTDYIATLRRSDVNLYAYSQDPVSVRYMGKGIPNKTCELLAAEKPILAYGPKSFAGIHYLRKHDAALIVHDKRNLADAIRTLRNSGAVRDVASQHAHDLLLENHDAARIRERFREELKSVRDSEIVSDGGEWEAVQRAWWGVLRPGVIKYRQGRAKRRNLARSAKLGLLSLLDFRAHPLSTAVVAILVALTAIAPPGMRAIHTGVASGALAWLGVMVIIGWVAKLGEGALDSVTSRFKPFRRISADYAHLRWPSLIYALLIGAGCGFLWRDFGWAPAAMLALLAALIAALAGIAGIYRSMLIQMDELSEPAG